MNKMSEKAVTPGKVVHLDYITRRMVQDNPETIFVFGDNLQRRGLGGQAKEMRGEPNSIGVPTKRSPTRENSAYFTDADLGNLEVKLAIYQAFQKIKEALMSGKTVVIPSAGLGSGLAQLPTRAPKINAFIEEAIENLGK